MKLCEVAKQLPQHTETEKWLRSHAIAKWHINEDGIVDVAGNVQLNDFQGLVLPIQFGIVSGYFDIYNIPLTSLKGCPLHVGGYFDCGNTEITSLQYAPSVINGNLLCSNTKIKSFSGTDKIVKQIDGYIECYNDIEGYRPTHILGLLLIKGVRRFFIDGTNGPISTIMNKYVGTGDILSAQDELIDAGFTDQARL
jgi:hypothetical protein